MAPIVVYKLEHWYRICLFSIINLTINPPLRLDPETRRPIMIHHLAIAMQPCLVGQFIQDLPDSLKLRRLLFRLRKRRTNRLEVTAAGNRLW
jgi:hypothetical protein